MHYCALQDLYPTFHRFHRGGDCEQSTMHYCALQELYPMFHRFHRGDGPPPASLADSDYPTDRDYVQAVTREDYISGNLLLEDLEEPQTYIASLPNENMVTLAEDERASNKANDRGRDEDSLDKFMREVLCSDSEASTNDSNKYLGKHTVYSSVEAARASSEPSTASLKSNLTDSAGSNDDFDNKVEPYNRAEVRLYSRSLFEDFSGDKVSCWLEVLECTADAADAALRNQNFSKARLRPCTSSSVALDGKVSIQFSRKRSRSGSYSPNRSLSSRTSDRLSMRSSASRQNTTSLCSSISSSASFNEWKSRPRRGRQHSRTNQRYQKQLDRGNSAMYQCTQCASPKFYANAYTWSRHEMTAHFPSELWMCARHYFRESDSAHRWPTNICSNCEHKKHPFTCSHRFLGCWQRPEEDRTFDRVDSMRQHLRFYHRLTISDAKKLSREACIRISEELKASYDLRCYFCGHINIDLKSRFEHIGKHFLEDHYNICDWLRLRRDENANEFLYRVTLRLDVFSPTPQIFDYFNRVKDTEMLQSLPPDLMIAYIRKLEELTARSVLASAMFAASGVKDIALSIASDLGFPASAKHVDNRFQNWVNDTIESNCELNITEPHYEQCSHCQSQFSLDVSYEDSITSGLQFESFPTDWGGQTYKSKDLYALDQVTDPDAYYAIKAIYASTTTYASKNRYTISSSYAMEDTQPQHLSSDPYMFEAPITRPTSFALSALSNSYLPQSSYASHASYRPNTPHPSYSNQTPYPP